MKVCIACDEIYADFMESCPVCGCKDLKGQEFAAQNTKKTREEELAELAKTDPILASKKMSSRTWNKNFRSSTDGPYAVWSNILLLHSRYPFLSSYAEKILTFMLSQISPNDIKFKYIKIDKIYIMKLCGLSSYGKENYKLIDNAIEELQAQVVKIEYADKKSNFNISIFSNWMAPSISRENCFYMKFNDSLQDVILVNKKKGNYTITEALFEMHLTRPWAIRLYRLAYCLYYNKSESEYEVYYTIEELKKQIGVIQVNENGEFGVDLYPNMGKFNEKCFKPTIKEINEKTDINISYEWKYEVRNKSRVIVGVYLKFSMKEIMVRRTMHINYLLGSSNSSGKKTISCEEKLLPEDPSDGWV